MPGTVITRITTGGEAATTMPKPLAVAPPFLLDAGGAAAALFIKENDAAKNKCLVVSAVTIAVYILMPVINLKK